MRRIIPTTAIALMLATVPAAAQTVEDPGTTDPAVEADIAAEGTDETTTEIGGEVGGNFSRSIPPGLMGNLTEEEINDYQTRLNAAATPQERNAIRQGLQRTNRERHVEGVQENKRERKGFFASMAADFNDVVSGRAAKDARAREKAGGRASKDHGKSKSGGKGGGKSGGGGGRNK